MKFTPLAFAGLIAMAQGSPDLDLDDIKSQIGDHISEIPDNLQSAFQSYASITALPSNFDDIKASLSNALETATGTEAAQLSTALAVASNVNDIIGDDDEGAAYAPTAAVAFAGLVGGVAVFFNM